MVSFRVFGFAFVFCIIFFPAVLGIKLDISVSQGQSSYGSVKIKAVDVDNLNVKFSKDISVDKDYMFNVDVKDRVLLLILDPSEGNVLFREFFSGKEDISIRFSLPSVSGFCGDGLVSDAESCDIAGGAGCSGKYPLCIGCMRCGCSSDSDCGSLAKDVGPCGFGRCKKEESALLQNRCVFGVCVAVYDCVKSAECKGKECPRGYKEQKYCEKDCSTGVEDCYYNQQTACWDCLSYGTVESRLCSGFGQDNCIISPDVMPAALKSKRYYRPSDFSKEFKEDKTFSEEEIRILDSLALAGSDNKNVKSFITGNAVFDDNDFSLKVKVWFNKIVGWFGF